MGGLAMKFMIASDIHGSAHFCRLLIDAYNRENADRLIILGDILYHGPRNDLPEEYAPKKVIEMLNAIKDELLCVRGNCDTEVDQMVLEFPIMGEYMIIPVGKNIIYATHGHIRNKNNMPPLKKGDVLLHGHTHIPTLDEENGIYIINTGSVSIPKNCSQNGYMIFENNTFTLKNLDGEEIAKREI